MATAAVQHAPGHNFSQTVEPAVQSKPSKKHDVATELYYYKDPGDGTPPAPSYVGKPETYIRPHVAQDVVVHDITGEEQNYTLDSHGFQIYTYPSKEKDFLDDEKIKAEYYPETEQLLKDATGAVRVFIFDHTIRRQPKDTSSGPEKIQLRGPVRRVHIDQSYSASEERVYHHLPEDAEELVKKRFQIVNVWRPIKQIFKDPLAVADSHSVPDSDLVGTALIYPDRRGETYSVKANPEHRWYYKYGQTPNEVTLIKCFDNLDDGRAKRVPHTAFTNPEEEDGYSRESGILSLYGLRTGEKVYSRLDNKKLRYEGRGDVYDYT